MINPIDIQINWDGKTFLLGVFPAGDSVTIQDGMKALYLGLGALCSAAVEIAKKDGKELEDEEVLRLFLEDRRSPENQNTFRIWTEYNESENQFLLKLELQEEPQESEVKNESQNPDRGNRRGVEVDSI